MGVIKEKLKFSLLIKAIFQYLKGFSFSKINNIYIYIYIKRFFEKKIFHFFSCLVSIHSINFFVIKKINEINIETNKSIKKE